MRKIVFLLLTLFILATIIIILFNQEDIVHPKRRVLQAYHLEWLEHPQRHSMEIVKEGYILIVKPNKDVLLSKRSQKIKDELIGVGFSEESLSENGIIVMYHGKNGRKEDLLPVAERYVTAGFVCVLVDLPAHGENPKEKIAYGIGVEQDLYKEVLGMAKKHIDVAPKSIYLWGMSLGGAYAIHSASTENNSIKPKALILVATFDKLSNVLEDKSSELFGDYLGKGLYRGLIYSLKLFYNLDPEKVDSTCVAKKLDLPLFMLHGKKDELIGFEYGENLFKNFSSLEKEFHLDEDGNHHNILVTKYPFYLKSIHFLLKQNAKRSYERE